MKAKQAALLQKIEESKQLDKDGEVALAAAVVEFKKSGAF
jgi:F-type H+-transporting ATPase subunit alpha